MLNAKSHSSTLRYPLIMYTILFTYVIHNISRLFKLDKGRVLGPTEQKLTYFSNHEDDSQS